jgi:probable HAF family extracellular repeat protein
MQDLGTLPGDNASAAVAINACTHVIGNSTLAAGGKLHGFIWSKSTGMVGLGTLPGFSDCGKHDINNLGQVVSYCAMAGVPNRGFLWSSAAGMQPLGSLLGGLGSDAGASTISAKSSAVPI